jgi:large subunit ribosomal protein L35
VRGTNWDTRLARFCYNFPFDKETTDCTEHAGKSNILIRAFRVIRGSHLLEAISCLTLARRAIMPKMKTHKASKKRFRITANGKLKRRQAGKKHLLSHKTGKRKRHLRETIIEDKKRIKKYILLMGGDA